jgi:hypothetical protein
MTTYPIIHLKKSYKKYNHFELVDDCKVNLPYNYKFIIPKGYTTDFATVPQLFWSIFPPHCLASMPSVVHDYMYDNRLFEEVLGQKLARKFADICFLENMKNSNVPKWQRYVYFYVVRIFAKKWWTN